MNDSLPHINTCLPKTNLQGSAAALSVSFSSAASLPISTTVTLTNTVPRARAHTHTHAHTHAHTHTHSQVCMFRALDRDCMLTAAGSLHVWIKNRKLLLMDSHLIVDYHIKINVRKNNNTQTKGKTIIRLPFFLMVAMGVSTHLYHCSCSTHRWRWLLRSCFPAVDEQNI